MKAASNGFSTFNAASKTLTPSTTMVPTKFCMMIAPAPAPTSNPHRLDQFQEVVTEKNHVGGFAGGLGVEGRFDPRESEQPGAAA